MLDLLKGSLVSITMLACTSCSASSTECANVLSFLQQNSDVPHELVRVKRKELLSGFYERFGSPLELVKNFDSPDFQLVIDDMEQQYLYLLLAESIDYGFFNAALAIMNKVDNLLEPPLGVNSVFFSITISKNEEALMLIESNYGDNYKEYLDKSYWHINNCKGQLAK
ncbi:hypothetical protein [Echinimonas agarilytica]|uniref:Lipoprotein n=1 Tax=Echinimonas agarilytica TaxID=1215918 RepID=A0AA42B7Q7_9GAMM|nr:hypothetical protein [Echinimonas agarilytica]MCM2680022.1 hypothetical protein [Echinimonas agarilytica]MCM2680032.1 hypothetical protein [Echinimonas agarilytica]